MDQPEVEILEPVANWQKEVRIPADLVTIQVPVQQIIINNEIQTIMGDAMALKCPCCGNRIRQFPAGIPEVEVVQALNTEKPELLNSWVYCSKCGQKLSIFRPMPVDGQFEIQDIENK